MGEIPVKQPEKNGGASRESVRTAWSTGHGM